MVSPRPQSRRRAASQAGTPRSSGPAPAPVQGASRAELWKRPPEYDPAFPLVIVDSDTPDALHTHEGFSEIVLVYEGRGTHMTSEESYPVRAGDAFVITGDTAHGYQDFQGFRRVTIGFQPRFFFGPMPEIRKMPGYHALFHLEPKYRRQHRFESRLRLTPSQVRDLLTMIAELDAQIQHREKGWEYLSRILFMQVVAFLCRHYAQSVEPHANAIQALDEVLGYMSAHLRDRIRLGQLAGIARMSSRNLLLRFRQAMGLSPIDYLMHLRIGEACSLLQHTNVPVTTIALDLGFCDSNYFARQFRRVMKMAPSAYRKRFAWAERGRKPGPRPLRLPGKAVHKPPEGPWRGEPRREELRKDRRRKSGRQNRT